MFFVQVKNETIKKLETKVLELNKYVQDLHEKVDTRVKNEKNMKITIVDLKEKYNTLQTDHKKILVIKY